MLRALRILDDAAPRRDWELHYVFSEHTSLVHDSGLPRERVRVVPGIADWRRPLRRLALPLTLAALARAARGADVLYSETLSTFPLCWMVGRLTGTPQVVHVYSSYGAARPYRKHWLERARHVVAPSADSLALAERAVGGFAAGTRARVAYNGMDVARIEREAAAPLPEGLSIPPGPRVGMVGNLDWRKNPLALVEATALVREQVPDVQTLLIGEFAGEDMRRRVLARVAALGLDGQVHVTGFLRNPFPVVRTLDVLAHPALRDPFPLALLEGMALARPIVASAVSGIPEMLADGESGLLVPPDDSVAMARGLVALLTDAPRRRAVGEAARHRLHTHFSLDGFADTMFQAFDEAVDGRAA
jgi:glycosyltransferase involved in cell wall biosynthesis